MWRFKSFTFWFAIALLIYGVVADKQELIGIAFAQMALREKTQFQTKKKELWQQSHSKQY